MSLKNNRSMRSVLPAISNDYQNGINEDISTDDLIESEPIESEATENPAEALIKLSFEQKIRPYIDVIDELRRHGLDKDISLPSVVVLGDQSSGKSSILEAISGVQLPRGTGIVTRCPLEMQLKRVECAWNAKISYTNTHNKPIEKEISDPSSVQKAIEDAQIETAGPAKGISHNLITLRIESENCPDLTLIDLPGIARTAVDGQDKNIGTQIRNLIATYISRQNTIILCVISANLDVAVNESISMALELDPEGKRTLGVISKPDLVMEKVSKKAVINLLHNRKVKLKNGYTMVRCRNWDELQNNVSLEEALVNEQNFFDSDPIYREANPKLKGIKNLAEKLTDQLVKLIRDTIPLLKEQVNSKYDTVISKLSELPEGPPTDLAGKLGYLMKIMDDLHRDIKDLMVSGRATPKPSVILEGKIPGNLFADWRTIFSKFTDDIKEFTRQQMKERMSPLSKYKIEQKLKENRGRELPRFLNYDLFEQLVRSHVVTYKPKALKCLETMKTHLREVSRAQVQQQLKHMQTVESDILEIVESVISRQENETIKSINLQFEEENLVYSQDFCYLEIAEKYEEKEREKKELRRKKAEAANLPYNEEKMSDDTKNAILMRKMIKYYLQVVNRRIADSIPMILRVLMHLHFEYELKRRLLQYVTRKDAVNSVTEENDIAIERDELVTSLKRLQIALNKLSRF